MRDSVAEQVTGHATRNQELITLIVRKGGDLAARRLIDLHFWAPDEESAGRLVEALREFGVGKVVSNQTESAPSLWNVEGQIPASVDQVVADAFVEDLVSLAVAHGSEFDGWGTQL